MNAAFASQGPRILNQGIGNVGDQVGDFWGWGDWLGQQASDSGREPLYVNLDETGVNKAYPKAVGMIVGRSWWQGRGRPLQRIPKKDFRQMVTHVGLCTHNTTVQGRLPQIWIGNTRIFTHAFMEAVAQTAPGRVKFWRRNSSWNNSELMLAVLTELSLVLAEFPGFQPILVLDCASIHLTPRGLRMASALGIWLLPVPARCIFLLQPLDTHVFSPYKAFLRRRYQELKDAHGNVTTEAWARLLIEVSTSFMCSRCWKHAFEQVGLIGDRAHLTRDIRAVRVALRAGAQVAPPSYRQMRGLLPRNRRVPYYQLLSEPLGRPVRLLLH